MAKPPEHGRFRPSLRLNSRSKSRQAVTEPPLARAQSSDVTSALSPGAEWVASERLRTTRRVFTWRAPAAGGWRGRATCRVLTPPSPPVSHVFHDHRRSRRLRRSPDPGLSALTGEAPPNRSARPRRASGSSWLRTRGHGPAILQLVATVLADPGRRLVPRRRTAT